MIKMSSKFLLILAFLVFLGCGGEELPEKDLTKPVPVKSVKATIQPVAQPLTYSGTAEPMERVRLSTKIMGWVEAIYFDEGDMVQKGQVVVKLRSKDLEAKRAQAEAGMAEAEAYFKNAQTNLRRIESLYQKKAATQKELDDVRTAFASAQARKKTAEEMKTEIEELLRYTSLTSPFDGAVTRKMIEVGDLTNPGQVILEVENTSKVKIVAKVPESDIRNLEAGMPVKVQIQASNVGTNGKSYEGTIDRIVPSADPMSRQFDIQVLMDNPQFEIKSGMFARITVAKSGVETLVVPRTAVFRRGQLEGVYVIDSENRANLRWIRTGVTFGDQIEVLSGLNPEERVVIEGASLLMDGQAVEVLP
jgi:RND family efflux transporter MFP subunit